MEINQQQVHPLFDPRGLYRLATKAKVWRADDAGRQTIRDFFETRRVESLREEWMHGVPESAQDWGLGAPFDAEVHEFLKARAKRARARGSPREHAVMRDGSQREMDALAPALTVLRLDKHAAPSDLKALRSPENLFSGAAAPATHKGSKFEINVQVEDLTQPHQYVVMILTRVLLEHVGQPFVPGFDRDASRRSAPSNPADRVTIATDQHALDVIQKAFAADVLSGAAGDHSDLAFRISMMLAQAPAITGSSEAGGWITPTVELPRECPGLDFGTWIAVCVGPEQSLDRVLQSEKNG